MYRENPQPKEEEIACAYCQRRDQAVFDRFAEKKIFIKAKAGSGTSTDEENQLTRYWEHAIMGQLIYEEFTYLKKLKASKVIDCKRVRRRDFEKGQQVRAQLRLQVIGELAQNKQH